MKNNLKIIDKNTLEELSSQLKDYLFKSKTTKLVRDMNKKIIIINIKKIKAKNQKQKIKRKEKKVKRIIQVKKI